MLNEVKHLGREEQVGIAAQGASHAVPRSFAAAQDDSHRVPDDRNERQTDREPPAERSHVTSDLQARIPSMLQQPRLAGLATITEDGKPWVRYIMVVASDDMTIRCATFVGARKVKQIERDPEVHVTCGVTDPQKMGPYLQIQGRATLNTSQEVRHAFWSDMLAPIFDGPDDPKYGVLEITPYYIEYTTPGSHEPDVWKSGS